MERMRRFACLTRKGCCEIMEGPVPRLGPHDVLIRNTACNICTTDYGQWLGLREHQGYPMAGGHEGCGVIEETGTEVTTCKAGDFVGINVYQGCGVCIHCRKGEFSQCENPPAWTQGARISLSLWQRW